MSNHKLGMFPRIIKSANSAQLVRAGRAPIMCDVNFTDEGTLQRERRKHLHVGTDE